MCMYVYDMKCLYCQECESNVLYIHMYNLYIYTE